MTQIDCLSENVSVPDIRADRHGYLLNLCMLLMQNVKLIFPVKQFPEAPCIFANILKAGWYE